MAITKLMHMKQSNTSNWAVHLKNSIKYICKDQKTKNKSFVGVNGALPFTTDPDKIFNFMMKTKQRFGKEDGRQGYHFVVSFAEEDEKRITKEDALKIINEIQHEYLQENYECVFAVHDDTKHTHGHIVFNSIDQFEGKKYHYKKGDWERDIQPVVNRICKRWGLTELRVEKEKKKKQNESKFYQRNEVFSTWDSLIRNDLDTAISRANDYVQFLSFLKKMGYKIKEGQYLSVCPRGKTKFRRTHNLGKEYSIQKIKQRIESQIVQSVQGYQIQGHGQLLQHSQIKNKSLIVKSDSMSPFLKKNLKKLYDIQRGRGSKSDYIQRRKYKLQALYLINSNINNYSELERKLSSVKKIRTKAYKTRETIYNLLHHETSALAIYRKIDILKMKLKDRPGDKEVEKELQVYINQVVAMDVALENLKSDYDRLKSDLNNVNKIINKTNKEVGLLNDIEDNIIKTTERKIQEKNKINIHREKDDIL